MQRLEKIIASVAGAGIFLGGGCVGPNGRFWEGPQQVSQAPYAETRQERTSFVSEPLPVNYIYYEPNSGSGSSDLGLLSFLLGATSFGMAQQGFIGQSIITDLGSTAAGRQAVIEGQKEAMQQGKSLYWPGSKPGFLIMKCKEFGRVGAINYVSADDNGDVGLEEMVSIAPMRSVSDKFSLSGGADFPARDMRIKIIDSQSRTVYNESIPGAGTGINVHFPAGHLKVGKYAAFFYGYLPPQQKGIFTGPPRGVSGQEYLLISLPFDITP